MFMMQTTKNMPN